MTFVQGGHTIKWSTSSLSDPIRSFVALASVGVLEELLHHFTPLFVEPIGLPP
jgi:hypothetical protein